jgi:hypothetical chaperone protein
MSICGLDFGTSNTTLGTIECRAPVLVALEATHTTIPSAIFYEVDGAVLIGRRAVEAYVEGAPGRLMRSLKSVLGTSLIDETTRLGRERVSFRDVIAYYLGAVKRRAEQATGQELRHVVHGRPVHFVDNAPDADRKAEETLRTIARDRLRRGHVSVRTDRRGSGIRATDHIRGSRTDRRYRRRHIGLFHRTSGARASRQGRSRGRYPRQ